MKLSQCRNCGRLMQFEHCACRGCGEPLGFLPETLELVRLVAGEGEAVAPEGRPAEPRRRCVNAEAIGCNWLAPLGTEDGRCLACRLNRNLADMSVPLHRAKWRRLEAAKRRLIYAMLRLGLPVDPKAEGGRRGLAFDFLIGSPGAPAITGHAGGLITINLLEADSVERERQRIALNEPYRTLLGHFRHEAGHFYQTVLVDDRGLEEACRAVFGDERISYSEAMAAYYAEGPKPGWEDGYVTAYATMHPWEDFAETWAHYLHMIDTLDTGAGFGLSVSPRVGRDPQAASVIDFDPYDPPDFARLVEAWLPLTEAVNSLNRSMGQPDLYPFDLTPRVLGKLRFIHDLVHPQAGPDVSDRAEEEEAHGPSPQQA